MKSHVWLKVAVACFVGFLLFALVSSVLGRSKRSAGLFQFVSDFKPLLAVALGYALMWDERCERWLSGAMAWSWLPMVAMVAFQWIAPGAFWSLTVRLMPDMPMEQAFFVPSRALGIFEHPSMLASVCAGFVMLLYGRWLCAPRSGRLETCC